MNMVRKPKVVLVGALPPPLGGVTVFLRRLIAGCEGKVHCTLLDLKKVPGKQSTGESHIISPFSNQLLALLWVQWKILTTSPTIYHFHFSNFKGLLLISLMVKRRSKFVISLHHGQQNLTPKQVKFTKLIRSMILKKIDTFHSLNANQTQFYKDLLGASDNSILQCQTYIKYTPNYDTFTEATKKTVEKLGRFILASGVCDRANRFDLLIKYWKERPRDGTKLLIIIYGGGDALYKQEIKDALNLVKDVELIEILPEDDFNYILSKAKIYVRAAEIDSFGIAVADANSMGVRVIASDVCVRAKNVLIYPNGDYPKLFSMIEKTLKETSHEVELDSSKDALESYVDLYHELSQQLS